MTEEFTLEELQEAMADIQRRARIIREVVDAMEGLELSQQPPPKEPTGPIPVLGRLCAVDQEVTVADLHNALADLTRRLDAVTKAVATMDQQEVLEVPEISSIRVIGKWC